MELKLTALAVCLLALACFNRTFMELKPSTTKTTSETADGFNRTFMELKLEDQDHIYD